MIRLGDNFPDFSQRNREKPKIPTIIFLFKKNIFFHLIFDYTNFSTIEFFFISIKFLHKKFSNLMMNSNTKFHIELFFEYFQILKFLGVV